MKSNEKNYTEMKFDNVVSFGSIHMKKHLCISISINIASIHTDIHSLIFGTVWDLCLHNNFLSTKIFVHDCLCMQILTRSQGIKTISRIQLCLCIEQMDEV